MFFKGFGRKEIVEVLLHSGADVHARDDGIKLDILTILLHVLPDVFSFVFGVDFFLSRSSSEFCYIFFTCFMSCQIYLHP